LISVNNDNDFLYIADDAIVAFQKQAQEDIPIFNKALKVETAIMKELLELKDKVDRLLQTRQCEL
jgi:predicted RNA-binding Zn ribbon-like protein